MSAQLAPELALVISLHGVVERIDHPEIQVNHLELAPFERLVDHVRERFTVVSLDDLSAALAGEARLPAPPPPPCSRSTTATAPSSSTWTRCSADTGFRSDLVPPGLVDERARVPTYVMRAALELTDAPSIRLPGPPRASAGTTDDRERAADRASRALRTLPRAEADAVLEDLRSLLSPAQWEEVDRRFASEELMHWPELHRLAEGGVVVGSHTRDHVVLHERQPRAEVDAQVVTSKLLLEERLGADCRHFCYPHGSPRDIGRDSVDAVRNAGLQ